LYKLDTIKTILDSGVTAERAVRGVTSSNAGPGNDPAHKRYVCRVIANMVATGCGAWTEQKE